MGDYYYTFPFNNLNLKKKKKLPGKVVAKRMMSIKSLKPYASMIAKKKSVSTIDLERELPYDKVSVKDIDKVMKEERDYKAEYEKFQSSPERIKYRSELNKYNREKGTYGNGDGKDASHKKGKIVGFEDQSKNRGRREKSRLKGSKRKMKTFKEHLDLVLENLNNPKQYEKPNFSEIKDPKVLSDARKLVSKAKSDGGVVFHLAGEGYDLQYATDPSSVEWPGNEALEDGFITVVYAKDFF